MYLDKQNSLAHRVIVSIPINFKSREAIALAVQEKYGTHYLFLGNIFHNRATNKYCLIDFSDRHLANFNLDLACSFELLEKQIASCQQVVYLISNDVGYDSCLEIAKFAQIFLSLGGIAVKVESAGIVHERDKWLAYYNSQDVFDIYSLFVVLVEGEDYYYSCGMHNFGKADVMLDLTEDISLAIYVLNVFNYYRLTEFPVLLDGQTFQPDLSSPMYQMQWRKSNQSETEDTLLDNPYGQWYLTRV